MSWIFCFTQKTIVLVLIKIDMLETKFTTTQVCYLVTKL